MIKRHMIRLCGIIALLVMAFGLSACERAARDNTCAINISCATVLNNMDKLDAAKRTIIPAEGLVLELEDIAFAEGESPLEVLIRVLRENRIHLDFVDSPGYAMSYVNGIANLYAGDAGELSGWLYNVNGEFMEVGAGAYDLQQGDVINWLYTCDMGPDVGYIWDAE